MLHGTSTNSRGVAILLNNTFEYSINDVVKDTSGNMLIIDLKISDDMTVKLVNIYGPNNDDHFFTIQ